MSAALNATVNAALSATVSGTVIATLKPPGVFVLFEPFFACVLLGVSRRPPPAGGEWR